MKEYRFVGLHADETESGRPLEPGSYTGPINERATKNKQLIDDGLLLPVEDGTAAAVAAIDEAATKKFDAGEGHMTDEEYTKVKNNAMKATTASKKKGDS